MIAEFLESGWACWDQNSRRKLDDGSRIKIVISDLYFIIFLCKNKINGKQQYLNCLSAESAFCDS